MPSLPNQNEQLFARASRLTAAYSHGGQTFTWGALFQPAPSRYNRGSEIVTGTVHSCSLAGDVWTIIPNRTMQVSSYTDVREGMPPSEVEYTVSVGGGTADTRESQRVLCYANDTPLGSLSAVRAIPGDGYMCTFAGAKFLCELLTSEAYASRPSSVDYRAETPTTITQRFIADISNVAVNLSSTGSGFDEYCGGKPTFDAGTAPLDGCYLLLWDGATYTAATRYVFHNTTTDLDDPGYLPADWGVGISEPTFWWDESSYEVRLSHCDGFESALLGYYLKDVVVASDINHDSLVVIESESAYAGIGDVADAYPSSSWGVLNDYDVTFKLTQSSIVHWRQSTAAGSTGIFCVHDGAAIHVYQRDEVDGSSTLLADHTIALPCQVRFLKSADSVEVSARLTSGDSWTVISTSYPTSLDATCSGILGVGRSTTGAAGYLLANITTATRTLMCVGDSAGRQHIHRFRSCPVVTTRAYPRVASTSITSIRNMTTNAVMSNTASEARHHYTISGDTIILYGEATGDDVRIIYAAPATTGSPPGDAPRTFNQPHYAQFNPSEDQPRRASGDVDENLANWRDKLTFRRPAGSGLVVYPGDSFSIIRGAGVWSEQYPPDLYWSQRNEGDPTWVLIDPSHYLVRAYQGLVLLTEEFVATLPENFCLMAVAKRYVASVDESVYNELSDGVQLTSNLWFPAFGPAGGGGGVSGYCRKQAGSHWAIGDVTGGKAWLPTDFTFGSPLYYPVTGGAPFALGECYSNPGGGWHYSDWGPPSEFGFSMAVIDNHTHPEVYTCIADEEFAGGDYQKCRSNWGNGWQTGSIWFDVSPFGGMGAVGYAGVSQWAGATESNGGFTEVSADFSFERIPIALNPRLRRLPEGSVILEAVLEVRFGGGKFQSWSSTRAIRYGFPDGDPLGSREVRVVNGTTAVNYCDDLLLGDLVDESSAYEGTVTTGGVGFAVVGIRHDSTIITANECYKIELPTDRIISTGSLGGVSSVTADEWCVVDITSTIKQLVNLLNSEIASDGWYLFPSGGSPSSVSTADSLEGYVEGHLPSVSTTFELNTDDEWIKLGSTMSGHWFGYETLEIRNAFVRVQFPGGEPETFPLITPPAV